jgi:hypothetical protein
LVRPVLGTLMGCVLALACLQGADSSPARVVAEHPAADDPSPRSKILDPETLDAQAPIGTCAEVWVRPDRGFKDRRTCARDPSPRQVAAEGGVVMFGSYWDVSKPLANFVPGRSSCGGPRTHQTNAGFIREVRETRREGDPSLAFVHLSRQELVPLTFAALDGFDASFLLRTKRPWQQVIDFFARDQGMTCRGACRWSDSNRGDPSHRTGRLRDLVDQSGGENAYQEVVYYLNNSGEGRKVFWPQAAIADLRNPGYRAWRVAEARRAVEIAGFDAVMLNDKFSQFRVPNGHWIGSSYVPDVDALNARQTTLWSAPPLGYGYTEYVGGWTALGRDLREAGVPYAVWLSPWPWSGRRLADPSHEDALVRETARGARFVMLRGALTPGLKRTIEEDLARGGARLVIMNPVARALFCN